MRSSRSESEEGGAISFIERGRVGGVSEEEEGVNGRFDLEAAAAAAAKASTWHAVTARQAAKRARGADSLQLPSRYCGCAVARCFTLPVSRASTRLPQLDPHPVARDLHTAANRMGVLEGLGMECQHPSQSTLSMHADLLVRNSD